MSANTLKDFIEPAVEHYKKKKLDDKIGTIIAKALGQLLCIVDVDDETLELTSYQRCGWVFPQFIFVECRLIF